MYWKHVFVVGRFTFVLGVKVMGLPLIQRYWPPYI